MSKAYVTKNQRVLMPNRDADKLKQRGYVVASDYNTRQALVVYELENGKSRPVGVVTKPEHAREVAKYAGNHLPRMVRTVDLMDLDGLSLRTGRAKSTICGQWVKHPDFPEPTIRFGKKAVWYWPEVKGWMDKRQMPLERKTPWKK